MTQLVELQDALPRFAEAGIKLYVVSYDEPDALDDFAKNHGITFPLLSDADSAVIRAYGILNAQIEPHEIPWYGLPYPGAFVLDESGVVIEKLFNRHWANRKSAESMLDGALGEILLGADEPSDRGGNDDIKVSATYHGGGGQAKLAVERQLVVRFELAPGLHIYDAPVPEGMVATHIDVSGSPGVHIGSITCPETRALRLPGMDSELRVWDGRVDFTMPVRIDDSVLSFAAKHTIDDIDIKVDIRYQACDDKACRLPMTESLMLHVPVAQHLAPDLESLGLETHGAVRTTMDTRRHMARLALRQLRRNPIKGLRGGSRQVVDVFRGPFQKSRRWWGSAAK